MSEFKLDRFKYRWRDEWSGGTEYRRDDIVRLNGKTWVCLSGHVADSDFKVDLTATVPESNPPVAAPRWTLMTSSKSFVGDWTSGSTYYLGDVVLKDGNLYECVDIHTASSFEFELSNWTLFADHIKFIGDWQPFTSYSLNQIVRYNGISYKCVNSHQSGGLLENNSSDWTVFNNGSEYRAEWGTSTSYRKNDLVKFGGSIFKALETHTSTTEFEENRWQLKLPGYQFEGEWSPFESYQIGDVVRYGGDLWLALENNIDINPFELPDDSTSAWVKLVSSYNFRGEFDSNNNYLPGEITQAGGNLYIALEEIGGAKPDGSFSEFADLERWELLKKGLRWTDRWDIGNEYYINDVVIHFGTAYVCNTAHIAEDNNFPGDNGSGFFFWDSLIEAGSDVGMSRRGDLLSFGLKREFLGDTSTLGTLAVPIGNPDQVLSIEEEEVFWRNYISDAEVIYVMPNGTDAEGFGTNIYKPFRTVKYALEYVEDNFDPGTPVTVRVSTGRYSEICPLIVPEGCVVNGDELRSTTIEANKPLPEYQNDYSTAHVLWVDHLLTYIDSIFNNIEFETVIGNSLKPNFRLPPTGDGVAEVFTDLIQDYKNYINFNVLSGNINPAVQGTNVRTIDNSRRTAAAKIRQNRDFIFEESLAFLNFVSVPEIEHSRDKIATDLDSLLRGIIYDLEFPGNYKTLLAARRYANSVNGSQLEDMFYLRNTTGLRDCTVEGLKGVLNPPGTFELFRRPTGKSFCSLDPGWGPDDERVWIKTRSPYIQNVTTIGTACIGQKIDGALHNGGNRSMVSNDFTQVLSDGIGAYVLNNGRAELVSVFTYYNQIGYFAENGGIIRATNGNNSYGRFGTLADGNDPTEIPQEVQVFNRNNQAVVNAVFAGEFTDQIFAFEYDHCGEQYSQAQATVTGAGANAAVEYEEFRDGGVFQLRLVSADGSGAPGGAGYLILQGNCQTGNSTEIQLAVTTDVAQEDIINMRIIIVSGDGTGQFGYIQSYNPASRVANVYKDSTDEPGWDHIISGTPIEQTLTTNAQYRIEPRITTTPPPFSTSTYSLPNTANITDATHGDTSEVFANLEATPGSGDTDISVPSVNAVFTVERVGPVYIVSLIGPGAGYNVGDTIIFSGDVLGGSTPANDLTITVTATTDDSTNSITGFVSRGVGISGRFVAIATPNTAFYSDDGESWIQSQLPSAANWKKVVSGNGVFVAIGPGFNLLAFSNDGINWSSSDPGVTLEWSDITYGNGKFVIVSENTNTVLYSSNGSNWTTASIPDDVFGDSTASQWQSIDYGQGKFVAISGSDGAVAQSTDGVTWTRNSQQQLLPSTASEDWINLSYGNNRWLAASRSGNVVYSLDGNDWYAGSALPLQDGSTLMSWESIKYFQGVFMAIASSAGSTNTGTAFSATSEDGLLWTERTLGATAQWSALAAATLNQVPTWVTLARGAGSLVNKIFTGATVKLRANITSGVFRSFKILDPGSGYSEQDPPQVQVIDNSFGTSVGFQIRIGNGVLPQPSFINRGIGYRTSSTRVAILGNGFADIIPEGTTLTVSGVQNVPGPGTQIRISGILDPESLVPDALLRFRAVTVADLGDDGTGAGTRLVEFRITPSLRIEYNLEHGTSVSLREQFSQCRITGHDFLDVGTGNFEETNYPDIYAAGNFFFASPQNEVRELNGGRVFYTSTDQDGNFRAGDLFAVQQATGIVTISADFFELDGLSELSLGGVRLGGSGTVVREFSTDPNFTEDTNQVIPTQRAVATFLANRLSAGGSELETNAIRAGLILIGTENNVIETTTGTGINVLVPASIQGNETHLSGHIVAQLMAIRTGSFDDGMQ